jgi:hypothetical protein
VAPHQFCGLCQTVRYRRLQLRTKIGELQNREYEVRLDGDRVAAHSKTYGWSRAPGSSSPIAARTSSGAYLANGGSSPLDRDISGVLRSDRLELTMGIVEFKVRSWSLPDVRSTLKSAHRRLSRHVRFVPILFAKVENRRTPKTSRKSSLRWFHRCKTL